MPVFKSLASILHTIKHDQNNNINPDTLLSFATGKTQYDKNKQ